MKRHSIEQIREARHRAIKKWRQYRELFIEDERTRNFYLNHPNREAPDYSWWYQEGRLNKLSFSCHHATCSAQRGATSFKGRKRKVYRLMDRRDHDAWGE